MLSGEQWTRCVASVSSCGSTIAKIGIRWRNKCLVNINESVDSFFMKQVDMLQYWIAGNATVQSAFTASRSAVSCYSRPHDTILTNVLSVNEQGIRSTRFIYTDVHCNSPINNDKAHLLKCRHRPDRSEQFQQPSYSLAKIYKSIL